MPLESGVYVAIELSPVIRSTEPTYSCPATPSTYTTQDKDNKDLSTTVDAEPLIGTPPSEKDSEKLPSPKIHLFVKKMWQLKHYETTVHQNI